MKKSILILLSLSLCTLLSAQVKNYIGATGELGEYSLMTKVGGADFANKDYNLFGLGISTSVGGTYEMAVKHFILNLGLQVGVAHPSLAIPDMQKTLKDVVDDEGDKLNYIYRQTDRRDAYTSLSLQVPVMIGMHFDHFYMAAGVKVGISFLGSNSVKTNISSAGDYEKFIDEFSDMPEHLYYNNLSFSKHGSTSFSPSVMPHFEIGYVFGDFHHASGFDVPRTKNLYRLGLFVDYGIMNLVDKGNKDILVVPSNFSDANLENGVEINDILSTSARQGNVNDLCVGLKFTALFPLKEKKPCVICR